ncbi:MAG: peptide deformylase [bacterium]|nr:peptide deformylase [bacterium]
MIKHLNILDEKDKILRNKNEIVTFPLDKKEKKLMYDMLKYLHNSQIEEIAEKYNLRPGMGLAGPQVGINKRFFVICHEEQEKVFKNYIVINPTIISHSEEKIYVDGGEGCLSVNRDVEGIIPRYARITISYFDELGNPKKIRAREELAVTFQHEIDHLNGILFTDRIDKDEPYKDIENMRPL